MAKLVVKEIGLYDDIEYDERGLPRKGKVATLTMKGNDFDKTLLLRIGGEPGAYWLTIEVEVPEPHRATMSLANEHVVVPQDGDAWITINIPLKDPPIGTYVFRVLLAGVELGRVGFEITSGA